jgi:hypothetical protein
MIGPGWMPSRPRPLVRVRRVFTYYPSYYARRRRPRRARTEQWPVPPAAFDAGGDGTPAGLPTATLHAVAHQSRQRLLLGDFQRWLFDRWAWLRPRSIPLLVACAALPGMLALADAIKHPDSRGRDDLRLHVRIDVTGTPGHVAVSDRLALDFPPPGFDAATETVLVGPPPHSLCVAPGVASVIARDTDRDVSRSFAICPSLHDASTR